MSSEVFYDRDTGIVRAVISGELSAAVTGDAASRGLVLARQNQTHWFIVDMCRTVVVDSTSETYSFMEGLAALGFLHSDMVAIIYSGDEKKHQFAETAAHNWGWSNIRYFQDMLNAESWLIDKGTR